jgi:hypothetical protein
MLTSLGNLRRRCRRRRRAPLAPLTDASIVDDEGAGQIIYPTRIGATCHFGAPGAPVAIAAVVDA